MYLLSYCGLRTNFFTSMVLNYDFCQFFFSILKMLCVSKNIPTPLVKSPIHCSVFYWTTLPLIIHQRLQVWGFSLLTHVCYYDLFSLHEWWKKWRGECKKLYIMWIMRVGLSLMRSDQLNTFHFFCPICFKFKRQFKCVPQEFRHFTFTHLDPSPFFPPPCPSHSRMKRSLWSIV